MPKKKVLTEKEKNHAKLALAFGVIYGFLILLDFIIIATIYTWSDWIDILIFSLLFIAPAYLTNAGMVFTGGGKPIDGGKILKDGRRLFGDHKTWNGLIKGPLYFGIPVSIGIFILFLVLWQFIGPAFQAAINAESYLLYIDLSIYEYYFIGGPFPLGFITLIVRIILCSVGASIGDLIGSCLKRRLNIGSGGFFPVVDQLDFAIFAILFTSIPALLIPTLFRIPDIQVIIFLLIITPSITIIGNNVGYYTGIKEVPW
ncbi:MAG: CDP-archaeol synthase [Promethearchaeota archaeon]